MSAAALWLRRLVLRRRDPDQLPRGSRSSAASTCGSTAAGISAPPTSIGRWGGSTRFPSAWWTSPRARCRCWSSRRRSPTSQLFALACGVAAIVGHVFSVFVRFRGGKGVATAAGVMLGLTPLALDRRARDLGGGAEAERLRLARRALRRPRRSRSPCTCFSGPTSRRSSGSTRSSPRRSSGSIAPTSGACSTAPRAASAAGPRRRRSRDAHRRARRGQLGHDAGQSARLQGRRGPPLGLRSRGGGGGEPRSGRTRCSCRACRSRRGSGRSRDAARGGRRRAKSIVSAPPSHAVRGGSSKAWRSRCRAGTLVVSATKGIETDTLALMSQVFAECLPARPLRRALGAQLRRGGGPGAAHRGGGRRQGRGDRAGRAAGVRHRRRFGCTATSTSSGSSWAARSRT